MTLGKHGQVFQFIVELEMIAILNSIIAAPSPDCTKCEKDSRHYVDHYDYLRCTPIMRSDCPKCVQRYECPRNYLVYTELDNSGTTFLRSFMSVFIHVINFLSF